MNRPGGILIIERRPRRPRACLNCDRVFVTTPATRLCGHCSKAAREVQTGALPSAVVALNRVLK
jgi:hypothetical protein